MKKTISNSGDLAGTTVYFYEGQKICETRDGSGNMVAQFIHGTQYIDELVMMRAADKGDLYIHQDANFNVIGVTDLGGNLIERYVLEPYGELTVHQLSSYGDRDGDGDVDATDKGTPGTTCTGTASGSCRILDLDFDGDYDATDATLFDNLDAGNAVHPGGRFSALGQHFGHQGLWLDAEAGQYQNRARWFGSSLRRFGQRDPFGFLELLFNPEMLYLDGMNSHAYLGLSPLSILDPMGTASGTPAKCRPKIGSTPSVNHCVCPTGDNGKCTAKDYLKAEAEALNETDTGNFNEQFCERTGCGGKCTAAVECTAEGKSTRKDSNEACPKHNGQPVWVCCWKASCKRTGSCKCQPAPEEHP